MNRLLNLIQTYAEAIATRLKREEGQTIVEYGLVIGGISLVLIGLFIIADLGDVFTDLIDEIDTVMSGEGAEPPAGG